MAILCLFLLVLAGRDGTSCLRLSESNAQNGAVPLQTPQETSSAANLPLATSPPAAASPRNEGPGARFRFVDIIRSEALKNALPPDVADAVAYIESGYHPDALGDIDEIGLMQIRPGTAAMLGFTGTNHELAAPETNIRYGVTYLAQAWRLASGNLCRALMKYRAGHGEEHMTLRSSEYCRRANDYLRRINSATALDFLTPAAEPRSRPRLQDGVALVRMRKSGRINSDQFWALHEARIRLLTKQVNMKWRRAGAG